MQLPYLLLYWNTKAVIKEWFCSLQVMLYHKRLCRCCGNGLDFSLSIHGLSSWEIHIRTGVAVFSYLMEGLEKMEPAFFLVVLLLSVEEKKEEDQSKRRRGNRHKMELRKFWLDMRKKNCHEDGQTLYRRSKTALQSTSLEVSKYWLDTTLSSLI